MFRTIGKTLLGIAIAVGLLLGIYGHIRQGIAENRWEESDNCYAAQGRVECSVKGCRCLIPDGPWR